MGEVPRVARSEISRVLRSSSQAQIDYDWLSRWYRLFIEPTERAPRRQGLATLAPRGGERLLEVGFGAGASIVALAGAVGPSGRVCGVDLAHGMARMAQGRVRRSGFADRTDLACGDAEALPYAEGSFDGIFLCFVLELFDTLIIPAVLAECHRVLRSAGRICIVALSKSESPRWVERHYEALHAKFPTLFDCRPIRSDEAVRHIGFEIERLCESSLWGLPVDVVLARNPA